MSGSSAVIFASPEKTKVHPSPSSTPSQLTVTTSTTTKTNIKPALALQDKQLFNVSSSPMVSMSTATTLVSTTDTIKTSILLPVMEFGLNVEKQSAPSKPPDNTSVQPSEGKVLHENLTDTHEKTLADLLGEPVGLSFDSDSDEEIKPAENKASACIADLLGSQLG
jgi:hypothetical protein